MAKTITAKKMTSATGRSILPLGFTLVEMLIVLAIISLLLGVAIPFFRGASQRTRIKGAIRSSIALLNYARWKAISNHIETYVYLEGGCLRTGEGESEKKYCPPSGITLLLDGEIIFLPSGEAQERKCMEIVNDIGQRKAVCASSLSGKISIESVKKNDRE